MRFVAELELKILDFSDWVGAARQFGKQTIAQCLGDRMVPKTPKRRRDATGKGPTMTRYLEAKKEDMTVHVPSPHEAPVVSEEQSVRRPPKRSAKTVMKQEPDKKRSRSSGLRAANAQPPTPHEEANGHEDDDVFEETPDRPPKKERFAKTSTPKTAAISSVGRPAGTQNRTAPIASHTSVITSASGTDPRSAAKSVQKLFSGEKGEPKSGERATNCRTPMTASKSAYSVSRHASASALNQQQRVQNEKAAMIRRVEAQQQRQEEAIARKNEMNHNKIELLKKKREERERRAAEKREEASRKELERLQRADEKKRALEQMQKAEAAAVSAQRPHLPYPPRSPMPIRSRPVQPKQQILPPLMSEATKRDIPPRSPMATRTRSRSKIRTGAATSMSPIKPVASSHSARIDAHLAAEATEQTATYSKKSTVVRASSRSKLTNGSPAKSPLKPISVEHKQPLAVDGGGKKALAAEVAKAELSLPKSTIARLQNISVSSSNANVSQSYEMTPLRTIQPSTNTDYGIEDLNSGDETDDEEAPRKRIPSWAQGANLKAAVIQQYYNCPETRLLTCGMESPDLSAIFSIRRARFDKRTSSALWDSPLWNPTKAANYPRVPRPASVPTLKKDKDGAPAAE
uniref:Inner centromere protein ARK-binding domain-containing protein n=1 Tax=Plectus sambesii TaxID=2011161 RepID=A0A914WB26_9BILA